MDPTLTALRTHLLATPPEGPLFRNGHTIHLAADCRYAVDAPTPTSAHELVELALTAPVMWCNCGDRDTSAVWVSALVDVAHGLPDQALSPENTRTSRLGRRSTMSPFWLQADPTDPEHRCCDPALHSATDWVTVTHELLAAYAHSRLAELAQAHGAPTTWVALPARRHLTPPAWARTTALDDLASFHPWAVAPGSLEHGTIAIFHLPDSLARAAVVAGAGVIDPAHVEPTTWRAARHLLTHVIEAGSTDPRKLGEDHAAAAAGDLFATAHAATH